MKNEVKININFPITASPVAYDINEDGEDELIITADKIYIFDLKSTHKPILTLETQKPCASTPAILKTKTNKNKILIVGSDDDNLYFFILGDIKRSFKFKTYGDVFSSPIIGDIDLDGFPEVILGSDDGRVYIIKLNDDGEILNVNHFQTNGFVSSSPALLPNDDGSFDIVIGSWDENLYRIDGKNLKCKWKTNLNHIIWSSPAVCDLNADGKPEIISLSNSINLLNEKGFNIQPFPVKLKSFTVSSPAICDVDNDDNLEFIVCSDSVYIFTVDGLKNFARDIKTIFWASPIVADIDGDETQEIIACDYFGNLWILSEKVNFKKKIASSIVSSPIAADIDGDGLIEIIICTMDGDILILPTKGKKSEWNNFRGNDKNGFLNKNFIPHKELKPNENLLEQRINIVEFQEIKIEKPVKSLKIVRGKRGKIKLWELKIELKISGLKKGIMYFEKNGNWFPSPLFGDGESFIARFPPLKKFSFVRYFLIIETWQGQFIRFPEKGFRFFISV